MNMVARPKARMKVSEFLGWAEDQPAGRYELVDGEAVMMSPERLRHNLVKASVYRALDDAVRRDGLPCIVFTGGVTVIIDEHTAREPDASVQCGVDVDLDSMTIEAPVIVVEVISPSSERNDADAKLVEYFSVPSIQHYLIVMPQQCAVVHHQRAGAGPIETLILRDGEIVLDPPGIAVTVAALLGPQSAAQAESKQG
jgi:Uma2 family endonuclease